MKFVKFKAGTDGVPLFINSDAVSAVQKDLNPESQLTLIATQDGNKHRVQESLDDVLRMLQQ